MRLLLDSSGPQIYAALAEAAGGGWQLVAELREAGRPPEGRDIGTLVEELLRQGGAGHGGSPAVGSIVAGLGPGSFIGTRVAISYANGYKAARPGTELLGVNSLAAISAAGDGLPVLRDARRGQWYLHIPGTKPTAGRSVVLQAGAALGILQESGLPSVLLEQAILPLPAEPPRRKPVAGAAQRRDPFDELRELARAAGVTLLDADGLTAAGMNTAAAGVQAADYLEPVYLRSFL